jgi:hypothetical protein
MKKLIFTAILLSSKAFSIGFGEGTPVRIAGGLTIPIEYINVGDEVVSCFENDCTISKVTQLVSVEMETLRIITSTNEVITAAPNQLFYVCDCWLQAKDLSVGDALSSPEGNFKIVEIEKGDREKLYSFEVNPHHNFYALGALVHNPYGLGNGAYGQHHAASAHSKGETKEVNMAAVGCYGKAAAKACVGNTVRGALTGGVTPQQMAANCALGAAGMVAGTVVVGDCDVAKGAEGSGFNPSLFDHNGRSDVPNGYSSKGNQGLVESVGNNTATSQRVD